MRIHTLAIFLTTTICFSCGITDPDIIPPPQLIIVPVGDSSFAIDDLNSRIIAAGGTSVSFYNGNNSVYLNPASDYCTYFLQSKYRTDTLSLAYKRETKYNENRHIYTMTARSYRITYHTFDSVKVVNDTKASDYGTIYLYY